MTNAFRHLPGYARFAHLLLETRSANPLRRIRSRTLDGFTRAQEDDLVAALGRSHFRSLGGGRVQVHVDRIIRDDHNDQEEEFWADLARTADPPPKLSDASVRVLELKDRIRKLPDSRVRAKVLSLLDTGSGWVMRVLRRYGIAEAYAQAEAVVVAATALETPQDIPVRLKDFSKRVLGDSHRLDPGTAAYRRLTDYLNEEAPERSDKHDRAWRRGVLEARNVLQNTMEITVLVGGQIKLQFSEIVDDRVVGNMKRGLATCLTLDEVSALDAANPLPRLILTVENSAPFASMAEDPPAGLLVVYAGGQPNYAVKELLSRPRLRPIPALHWGDVDVGGFLVLHELQRRRDIRSFLMDAASVRKYADRLTRFRKGKDAYIARRINAFPPSERAALQACLDLGGFLEQESLPLEVVRTLLLQRLAAPTEATS